MCVCVCMCVFLHVGIFITPIKSQWDPIVGKTIAHVV